ncbi:uncharacterized protein LOC123220638 isoform X2 [Mangifera indica]|uniref:uncharacterized protein LOC123220638 isoform X2 n=1 Tax=Mangifera indica TaxID=29780 RepID=UPI001CFB6F83|nr:uncharacterized protein LOC123220638 isoform X2 [Mangifera indica]
MGFATLQKRTISRRGSWINLGSFMMENNLILVQFLHGLGLQVVENVEGADFIRAMVLKHWGFPFGEAHLASLEDFKKILELCAAKKIPMIVANPDYVIVEPRAQRVMPGTLASKYEKPGGELTWMDKLDKIIYKSVMNMVGVAASNSIAVGDSLHHDIKGANAAGIQSVFTIGGIHANELGLSMGAISYMSAI